MSKFFEEFKKFITRGNVIDMAVGVIVGSAFTAIVNALGNNILKPVVNWLLSLVFGANSLSEVFTFLKTAYDEAGAVDLANSIYIDWGAFINAIINFFITAFVLFCIVKSFNKLREGGDKAETVFEIADLLYHITVMMIEMGISVDDVTKELAKRHVVDHKVKQEKMQ